MRSRVTFGLSMAFDFDVYLMDEVSSAGDERFRKRSMERLEELSQKADFMLVDHNLWGLQFHCNRALLLHDGKLRQFNDPAKAITVHKRLMLNPLERRAQRRAQRRRAK